MIKTSAPGKLVLLGEYGVLESGQALVMAVNRRVHVAITPHDTDRLKVSLLPLHEDAIEISIEGDELRIPINDRPNLSLVLSIVHALRDQGILSLTSLRGKHLMIDSRELYQGHVKLGLGSSAAVTVALTAALYALSSVSDPPTLDTLLKLHREFQGSGSGVDIASSLHGGVISFQRDGASNHQVETLRLPQQLNFCPIWAGHSADTGVFLTQLRDFAEHDPSLYKQNINMLKRISAHGIRCIKNGDHTGFVASVQQFAKALHSLGKAAQLDIVSDEHSRLGDLLSSESVAYKSCGAGGGDIGVAVGSGESLCEWVATALTHTPFKIMALTLDNGGLKVAIS